MRFVTIQNKGHAVPGVVIGDDVLDLKASQNLIPEASGLAGSVRDILAGGVRRCRPSNASWIGS